MKLTEVTDRLRKLQDPKVVGVVYDGTLEVFDDKDIEAFKIAEKIVSDITSGDSCVGCDYESEKDTFGADSKCASCKRSLENLSDEEAKQIAAGGQAVPTEDCYTVIQSGPVNMTIKNDGVMDITL